VGGRYSDRPQEVCFGDFESFLDLENGVAADVRPLEREQLAAQGAQLLASLRDLFQSRLLRGVRRPESARLFERSLVAACSLRDEALLLLELFAPSPSPRSRFRLTKPYSVVDETMRKPLN
jgi:hypothetical protein